MGAMICSGTLVAPDVVLAAGHCQERFAPQEAPAHGPPVRYYFSLALDVSAFGPLVPHLPADAVQVRYFLPHPDFAQRPPTSGLGRAADLGLFFLADPVTSVAPAALVSEPEALVAGARVTIVGYGRRMMASLGSRDNGIKYQGESTIRAVGPYEMHVGSGGNDALKCHGDSGGPTYMEVQAQGGAQAALVGITSRALDWAGCLAGGVDTRVDAYLPWIQSSIVWACRTGLSTSCGLQTHDDPSGTAAMIAAWAN